MTTIKILGRRLIQRPALFDYGPGYRFVDDPNCVDYDWLVVFDELKGVEKLCCPRERTILCTWEPVSIKGYSRAYTRQFGHLLTNRPPEAEKHPHYHLGRGYFPWFLERSYEEARDTVIQPKTRVLSTACSSKQMKHTQHYARYCLTQMLATHIPAFDWFGHGVRDFEKKSEVLDAYKYHVVIENHIAPHHWTEKIADAWLCECLPFYAGDPILAEIFPAASFIPIPLHDPESALKIIKKAIADSEYEKRLPAIREAKRLILARYNLWQQVIDVIEAEKSQPLSPVDGAVVYNRKYIRSHSLSAMWDEGLSHLKQYLHLSKRQ